MSSVSVAGRDEAHHVPAYHRLRAALARFRRIFELLANGDAEAELDEALQILVGPVDGHSAHRDVLAEVLAAFGEDDAQRLRGDDSVFEEELVEVAHPVPEDAVRVRSLDFEELRHGGCGFADGRDARRQRCGGRDASVDWLAASASTAVSWVSCAGVSSPPPAPDFPCRFDAMPQIPSRLWDSRKSEGWEGVTADGRG